MLWVPLRWQLADGLTKAGLSGRMQDFIREAQTKLHEESAQEIRRQAASAVRRSTTTLKVNDATHKEGPKEIKRQAASTVRRSTTTLCTSTARDQQKIRSSDDVATVEATCSTSPDPLPGRAVGSRGPSCAVVAVAPGARGGAFPRHPTMDLA